MKTTQRNTKAEEFGGTLIPKGTTLAVGIKSVSVFVNQLSSGDHKGRNYDKYKTRVVVLEPGDFQGSSSSLGISCRSERRTDGAGNVIIDNYGNSRAYVELLKAMDPSITDETLPMPETDDEAREWGESWCGKIINVTFGTYTFKNNEGKEVVINTFKEAFPLSADQEEALKTEAAVFKAEIAAATGGGGVSDDDDLI